MYSEDPVKDEALKEALEYVILVTRIPYFLHQEYKGFLKDVQRRLVEPPFYSHLDSVDQVGKEDRRTRLL